MARFETAGQLISDAAVECGLAPIADPYASAAAGDANSTLFTTVLKTRGRKLWREHPWQHLDYIHTFNTVASVGRYALPLDFGRIIDQTEWNRTNRLPQGGPLSPQEFEYFKARLVGVVFTTLFRLIQNNYQVYPDTATPGNFTLAFEYISSFWVLPIATQATSGSWQNITAYPNGTFIVNSGNIYQAVQAGTGTSGSFGPLGTGAGIVDGTCLWNFVSVAGRDNPSLSTDVILMDANLMVAALALRFKQVHRMTTQADTDEYNDAFTKATDDDSLGAVIALNRGVFDMPLLGERNLPVTGFGA